MAMATITSSRVKPPDGRLIQGAGFLAIFINIFEIIAAASGIRFKGQTEPLSFTLCLLPYALYHYVSPKNCTDSNNHIQRLTLVVKTLVAVEKLYIRQERFD